MTTTNTTTPKVKKSKPQVACWCGCGGLTKSRFVPGHDAKLASRAKAVVREEADMNEELDLLPHADAREEFEELVERFIPVIAAQEAAKKAKRKAAKAAAAATEPEPEPTPEPTPATPPTDAVPHETTEGFRVFEIAGEELPASEMGYEEQLVS